MKIQFHESTWVLKSEGGGFTGHYTTTAFHIKPELIDVKSVTKDKCGTSSVIWVATDGCCDGENVFLINVPISKFKVV